LSRDIAAVRAHLLARARARYNPVSFATPEILEAAMAPLRSTEREHWGEIFLAAAQPFTEQAASAEAAGDRAAAIQAWGVAYNLCQIGRYPAPNSPAKRRAYDQARAHHARLLRLLDPSAERVEMPFRARAGEAGHAVGHLRKPAGAAAPLPLVVTWGGIDSFKEERAVLTGPFLEAGLAVLAIDIPGTGEAPLVGAVDAERLWDAVFDWIDQRPDLDSARVGLHGLSTGGYWATKLAHTHRARLRAVINQGGCVHFAFQPDWARRSADGEYSFELLETLATTWGMQTAEEWVAYAPCLSLLDQGVLDQPCAPMLLVNGVNDSVFPIADMELLLRHGDAKQARFFEGFGHMGPGAQTVPLMVGWLRDRLAV
jgi:esterase FrsA